MQHRVTIDLVALEDGAWFALIHEAGQALRSVKANSLPNALHETALLLSEPDGQELAA